MALDKFSGRYPPPSAIPHAFLLDFAMGDPSLRVDQADTLTVLDEFQNASTLPQRWTREGIENRIWYYSKRNFNLGYEAGILETQLLHDALMQYRRNFKNGHCVVIGSQSPWVEAMLLKVGAARVTTIEYNRIISEDPRVDTMTPSDWAHWYRDHGQNGDLFDCAVSYSSLEHAGLGRYGDIINPWGDLIVMDRIKCSLQKGALAFIGLPWRDEDGLCWNWHRYYGPRRWAQLLANMKVIAHQRPSCTSDALAWQGVMIAQKLV